MDIMQKWSRFCYRPDLGLMLIRIAAGATFVHHGWMKLQNTEAMGGFFTSLGLPEWVFYVVLAVELIGGLMLLFGVAGRAAAVALGIVALYAAVMVKVPGNGFASAEFELLLAAVSFGLALHGSGSYRVSHLFEHDGRVENSSGSTSSSVQSVL